MFGYRLLKGDTESALKAPLSIVFSESQAQKYFGDEDPIGKHIPLDNGNELIVTGVLADIPDNTHNYFDILLSFTTLAGMRKMVIASARPALKSRAHRLKPLWG